MNMQLNKCLNTFNNLQLYDNDNEMGYHGGEALCDVKVFIKTDLLDTFFREKSLSL